jgi:threonine dehydrogenase-like Zn-dependent dehydrogenase
MNAAMSGVTTMRAFTHPRIRFGLALAASSALAAGVLLSAAVVRPIAAATESSNRTGVACTTDAAGGTNPTFNLTTRSGLINLADGTTAYTWGFSEGAKPFQHPGPVLCVKEGDTVTVILHNAFTATTPKNAPAVSIVFPGQENVLADGAPSQPVFDGGGVLTSLAKPAQPGGGTVTYSFVASKPGTYLYESGGGQKTSLPASPFSSPQIQVRMGQANVRRWTDELLAMLVEDDPFGVDAFATHHLPLTEAPDAYAHFQKKEEGMVKVVFQP